MYSVVTEIAPQFSLLQPPLPRFHIIMSAEDARGEICHSRALSDADKFAMKELRGLHNDRAAGRDRGHALSQVVSSAAAIARM